MKKAIVLSVLCVFLLGIGASFLSYREFRMADPFAVAEGFIHLACGDDDHVELRSYPKVIIARPEASLDDYMAIQGYALDEDRQLGALRTYTTGDFDQLVLYSVNRFYAKWLWQ